MSAFFLSNIVGGYSAGVHFNLVIEWTQDWLVFCYQLLGNSRHVTGVELLQSFIRFNL